jgi:hypothetical protein
MASRPYIAVAVATAQDVPIASEADSEAAKYVLATVMIERPINARSLRTRGCGRNVVSRERVIEMGADTDRYSRCRKRYHTLASLTVGF